MSKPRHAAAPLENAMIHYGENIAFEDGESKITYAELDSWLANSEVTKATCAGDHIAWCPKNDREAFLTFWSLQRQGCVACPLSHRFPDSQREEILRRIDAKWLSDLMDEKPTADLSSSHVALPQAATIILTSGSTGLPKAVVHSMEAHVASANGAATNMPLAPDDRWLWSLPLCHVSGLSILVRCALASATVVGISSDDKLDAELLSQKHITHLSLVPTQLRRLLEEPIFPNKQLKSVLLGGSSVDPKLVSKARERGVQVSTTYGLTEMASQVTTSSPTDDPAASGRLLPGREIQITASGEILVRGKTLCLGYYGVGKLESASDGQGWFHTGDLGEWNSDAQLIIRGRMDNMFISGGENIHPENIERAMLSTFDLQQVIVVPQTCKEFGMRPVAFVQGDLPTDWEQQLRQQIQGFEIPVAIFDWPNETGGDIKPSRSDLQERAAGSSK